MPTYNRFPHTGWKINEAVESFLRQTCDDAELLIINDTPGQTLSLARPHPRTTIYNLPRRMRSLGEKLNFAIGQSRGQFLFRWDDDDISMPWRIEQARQRMLERGVSYWKCDKYWFNNPAMFVPTPAGMPGVCFTAEAFYKTRGYAAISVGEDQRLEQDFAKVGITCCAESLPPEKFDYIYRWGGKDHLSAHGNHGYDYLGRQPIVAGEFVIEPAWQEDYVRKAAAIVQRSQQ